MLGWLIIDTPQKLYFGWSGTGLEAENGACIRVDMGNLTVGGNTIDPALGGRALKFFDVRGTKTGSAIEWLGPLRRTPGTFFDTIGSFSPQSNGYPFRMDRRGKRKVWTAPVGNASAWTEAPSATGKAAVADGLYFEADGTAAYVDCLVWTAAEAEKRVGKWFMLRARMTGGGSGQLAMNARMYTPMPSGLTPEEQAAWTPPYDMINSARSWYHTHGFEIETWHCWPFRVERSETGNDFYLRVFANDDGETPSTTANATLHYAEIIDLDADDDF